MAKQTIDQQILRDVAWETGKLYPIDTSLDLIALSVVHPHCGFIYWQVMQSSIEALKEEYQHRFNNSTFIIRVYDVTDILFNGSNAHYFYDIQIHQLAGKHYLHVKNLNRNFLVEVGFRLTDGHFHSLARSTSIHFPANRPTGYFHTKGFYNKPHSNETIFIENVFNKSGFLELNKILKNVKRQHPLSVLILYPQYKNDAHEDTYYHFFIKPFEEHFKRFHIKTTYHAVSFEYDEKQSNRDFVRKFIRASRDTLKKISKSKFHAIHCHDWASSHLGLRLSRSLKIPLLMSLHSTEQERSGGESNRLSKLITKIEKRAIKRSDFIITAHDGIKQNLIDENKIKEDKITVIPDAFSPFSKKSTIKTNDVVNKFGLPQDHPIILFAGEISHAYGADLLVECLPSVCWRHPTAHIVFVGEGPLKNELQNRVNNLGIGNKCRFVGHLGHDEFEEILSSCQFVVIPARTWQDEGLTKLSLEHGKPVLVTHQSGIKCITHGENGLMAFDNPNSITWGLNELLSNPMQGSMMKLTASKSIRHSGNTEDIALKHYQTYEKSLLAFKGAVYV